MKGIAVVVMPFVALLALLLGMLVVLAPDLPTYACSTTTATTNTATTTEGPQLTSEQWRAASTIVAESRRLGVPEQGAVIAIAAAIQESGLRNLDYGDRDSLGLFQQRPSMGWGSTTQVKDPVYAARAFFAGAGGNRGLLDIPGWRNLPLWLAADSVQHSAFPTAYAAHEARATAIVQAIGGGNQSCTTGDAICPPVDLPVLTGLTPDARQVVFCVVEHFGIHNLLGVGDRPGNASSDHPSGRAVDVMVEAYQSASGRAVGDTVAGWLQEHAHKSASLTSSGTHASGR